VKDKAIADKFVSASSLAERAIIDGLPENETQEALPSVRNIARAANLKRRKHRPQEPTTLDFELHQEHFPTTFLQVSISDGQLTEKK